MSREKDLEKKVLFLEERISALEDCVESRYHNCEWLYDAVEARAAADNLGGAFGWEDCPLQPDNFETWEELYDWLYNLGEE